MRYALDILAILTVVPKTQLLLAESVDVLDEGGSSVSTVGQSLSCLLHKDLGWEWGGMSYVVGLGSSYIHGTLTSDGPI